MSGARSAVRDAMTIPAAAIGPEVGLREAVARLLEAPARTLSVVDAGGHLVGVLSEADLVVKVERPPPPAAAGSYAGRVERRRWSGAIAGDLMSRPPVTVGPDAGLADAARLMRRHGLRCLPVVDGDGRPIGTVSRGDLLRVFLQDDETVRRERDRRGG